MPFKTRRSSVVLLLLPFLVNLSGATRPPQPRRMPVSAALIARRAHSPAIQARLRHMSLREKIGQMIMPSVGGMYHNFDDAEVRQAVEEIRQDHVGGFCLIGGRPYDVAALTNHLQRASRLPLLISANFERAASFVYQSDSVEFPSNMAIAAGGDLADSAFEGRMAALEARATGVQWLFAPDSDVNDNPANPVINVRSYGSDPAAVGRFVAAFVSSAQQYGVLTTAKHFPGHGNTSTDSHIGLPTIPATKAELERVELVPFRAAIAAGTSSVMSAHIAVPKILGDPHLPSTLSPTMLTGVLRDELRFHGLIVTDALNMGGVARGFGPGEAVVRAVLAGADVLLMPPDPHAAAEALYHAVRDRRVSVQRINESVARILAAKQQIGLFQRRTVQLDRIGAVVKNPQYQQRALAIAEKGVTLVRDRDHVLPLSEVRPPHVLLAVFSSSGASGSHFAGLLRSRAASVRVMPVTSAMDAAGVQRLLAAGADADVIIAAAYTPVITGSGVIGLPPAQARALHALAGLGAKHPLVLVSFGNPYLLGGFPEVGAYLTPFGGNDVSEDATAAGLFGESAIGGRLPIDLPGVAPLGSGLDRPIERHGLAPAAADSGSALPRANAEIERAIQARAFPGAALAVGYRGKLVEMRGFGHFTYAPHSSPVTPDTIYDLASLTKVTATTPSVMLLYDRGLLHLSTHVGDILWRFDHPEPYDTAIDRYRKQVTVRELLEHIAGLPAWLPLYRCGADLADCLPRPGQPAVSETQLPHPTARQVRIDVDHVPLIRQPDTKYQYSDFSFMLLGQVVENMSGEALNRFAAQNLFHPLGMTSTGFRPARRLDRRIPPEEQDTYYRHRLVQGFVDDENAYAQNGVSGHAGLFSDARDLARYAQMMLNDGYFDGHRYLRSSTVQLFTRRQPDGDPASTRGLGWDTLSAGGQWQSPWFSKDSYGHTGFTGTSIWIDPDRRIFVILLTNRIYPTRDNLKILKERSRVYDAVLQDLGLAPRG